MLIFGHIFGQLFRQVVEQFLDSFLDSVLNSFWTIYWTVFFNWFWTVFLDSFFGQFFWTVFWVICKEMKNYKTFTGWQLFVQQICAIGFWKSILWLSNQTLILEIKSESLVTILPILPLIQIFWYILTSYLKFDMPKALKWGILRLCISHFENMRADFVLRCQNLLF